MYTNSILVESESNPTQFSSALAVIPMGYALHPKVGGGSQGKGVFVLLMAAFALEGWIELGPQ